MEFQKYMHLERFGTTAVAGIEIGTCHIFPKLDGTNASLWGAEGNIRGGSRNRTLSIENDNAGFLNWAVDQDNLQDFISTHPNLRLFGEWLVPHSLKTYLPQAWRKFYVFDVFDEDKGRLLSWDEYKDIIAAFEAEETVLLHPMAILKNAPSDKLYEMLEKNQYRIQDGQGAGEGIVIKNYGFQNKFGDQIWAKIVSTAFKEAHVKEMGANEVDYKLIEQAIVDEFLTQEMIDKIIAKIKNEAGGWESKFIPRLLQTAFFDLVTEETWNFIKKHKNPKIDFGVLQRLTVARTKELGREIF